VDEGRRQHQVLSGEVEIEGLHHLEMLEILLRDEGHGDVVDVELVLLDQVQQKIEGPFKDVEFDLVAHGDQTRTASRTSSIVARATCRARSFPSAMMSSTSWR